MISLPIDEMLLDLQSELERFENEPTMDNFDRILRETQRIEITCEDELPEN